jgi:hypothetical protein
MKKIILSLVVVAALSTSCKKDYTCVCKSNGTVVATTTINGTKSTASNSCQANGTAYNAYTCALQ